MKNKAGRDVLQPRSRLRPNKKGSPGLQFVCALGTEHNGTSARGGRDQPRQFKREDAKQQEKGKGKNGRVKKRKKVAMCQRSQRPAALGEGGVKFGSFWEGSGVTLTGDTLFWANLDRWVETARSKKEKEKQQSAREGERERERQVRSSPTN